MQNNIDATVILKNGFTIKVNFTMEAFQEVLFDFRDFDPTQVNTAPTQTIRVVNDGKLRAVIRCDEIAAITS